MSSIDYINQPSEISWKALSYFDLYRFLITFLFASLVLIGQLPEPLGIYDRALFSISAYVYLLISLIALFFTHIQKPPYVIQVIGQVISDIVMITLFMYASAGLNSGFGMLMVIVIAGGGILTPGRIGILFAAVATISVLGHEAYIQLSRDFPPPNYIHAGFLGITFFMTAFIGHVLAIKVQESEALAKQREVDLEKLFQLNEHIVQRLFSGIIVLDEEFKLQLFNESAKSLLGFKEDIYGKDLVNIAPELFNYANKWKENEGEQAVIIRPSKGSTEVQASFVHLHLDKKFELLIFLDDVMQIRQRAQQMKLASLGRLTASIAHEVRNPLGAISHASQLLSESNALAGEEKRLTAIIEEHSNRVNNIIENVMSISRRVQATPVSIELNDWLEKFTEEFRMRNDLKQNALKLKLEAPGIMARMDPSQLNQILWNICENGIRYSRGTPLIEINCNTRNDTKRPYIDIVDHGPGICIDIVDQLFEPFVTTNSQGTGLGLFIARELCEANQATLNLHFNTAEGCCFRINFSHPEKRHGLV